MTLINNPMRSVATIGQRLQFVSNSQDVQAIKDSIGGLATGYDSFFVAVGEGEYTEVWGMCGIVPRLTKIVTRLV